MISIIPWISPFIFIFSTMAVGTAHAADQHQPERVGTDTSTWWSEKGSEENKITAFEIPNTLTSHTAHIHDLLFQPYLCAYT